MSFRSPIAKSLNGAWDRAKRFVLATAKRSATNFEKAMQARLKGPTGVGTLKRRTGALARSVDAKVMDGGMYVRLSGHVGGGAPYAKIHEKGGVITPKRARYLAIPLAPAKTAAGVTRLASPRLDPSLKLIKSRKGTLLLGRVTGKGKRAKFTPFWVLKRSVTIPARLGFERTWRAEIEGKLRPRVRRGLRVISAGGVH